MPQTAINLDDLARSDAGAWAILNGIYLPSAGCKFSFKNHEYLEEPYRTQAPLIVVKKGAQLGFSERSVIRSVHDCGYRLKSGLIYYFPTKVDVTDFSKARFGPLISANPIMSGLVKDTDAANIKLVGRCMLYLRGLRTATSAKTAVADKLVFDEIDEAPEVMVDLARKRLDHSDFQEVEALSTPTMPDYGVDKFFQLTDQRHRMLYCQGCGHYTCMERDFPKCLGTKRDGTVHKICSKCGKDLDLGHERNEYAADFPGKLYNGLPAVGWRISQLQSIHVPAAKILAEFEEVNSFRIFITPAWLRLGLMRLTAWMLTMCWPCVVVMVLSMQSGPRLPSGLT